MSLVFLALIGLRNGALPKAPNHLSDISLDQIEYTTTNLHARFLLFDSENDERIVGFASEMQLEILSSATRWHCDGTFKSSPKVFVQLYVINAWHNDAMHACFYCLLPGKSEHLYEKMLTNLVNYSEFYLNPTVTEIYEIFYRVW